jgi:hypothetical protein
MVKLLYNGLMARGLFVGPEGSFAVEKGQEYEIPSRLRQKLLDTGEWKEVSPVKAKKKEKEKVSEDNFSYDE